MGIRPHERISWGLESVKGVELGIRINHRSGYIPLSESSGELPSEIDGVLNTRVHALAARRAVDVRRIPGHKKAAASPRVAEEEVLRVWRPLKGKTCCVTDDTMRAVTANNVGAPDLFLGLALGYHNVNPTIVLLYLLHGRVPLHFVALLLQAISQDTLRVSLRHPDWLWILGVLDTKVGKVQRRGPGFVHKYPHPGPDSAEIPQVIRNPVPPQKLKASWVDNQGSALV
ncbi:unnamed protein product [Parascedosporium putredinis]|uniref:Uncharacterized protein n=1 Tax=Parascedosporium putredinis TaxID=1442378 RepID=A0A9P1HB47_9PEZI|nr:unnamed protein product [Parascedosporium putredinis]CAI8003503.1 unnamed protein product [Parascedosporium putredinis]